METTFLCPVNIYFETIFPRSLMIAYIIHIIICNDTFFKPSSPNFFSLYVHSELVKPPTALL